MQHAGSVARIALGVFLGEMARLACEYMAMSYKITGHLFVLWLTLTAVNGGWEVSFASHPSNVAVLLVTWCEGQPPTYAYQRADVLEDGRVWVRWPQTERGRRCSTDASLLRNEKLEPGGLSDPTDEHVVESASGGYVY
jgi:hypothetical protein